MASKITDTQRALLRTALENAVSGKSSIMAEQKKPAPQVEPVNSFGVLEPDLNDAINNTYIVISPALPANDIVSFYWNGDYSIPSKVSDGTPMKVKVPPALVIAAANTTITVLYSVIDASNPGGVPSEPLSLTVGRYTAPAYPEPVITEAREGVLDVSALTADPKVTVAAWPGIAVGQKLWLSMTSTPPVELNKWVGFPITNTGAQSTTLGLPKLKTLVDGSTIVLKLEVSFDGTTKVAFPTTSYRIKQKDLVTAIAITNVTEPDGTDIPEGGTTTATSVTVNGTFTTS